MSVSVRAGAPARALALTLVQRKRRMRGGAQPKQPPFGGAGAPLVPSVAPMWAASSVSAAATDALDALVSTVEAAYVAKHKGRWARAAELFERAASAAAAGGAPHDSLVVLDIRIRAGLALLDQAQAPGSGDDAQVACARAWDVARRAMRTLCARADAGTLLPGGLRADELAYALAVVPVELKVEARERARDADRVAALQADAALFGYATALNAALIVLGRLLPGQMALPPPDPVDASAARFFLLRVLELAPAVRHRFALVLGAEVRLAHALRQVLDPARRGAVRGGLLDAGVYDALLVTWQRADVQAAFTEHGVLSVLDAGNVEKDWRDQQARRASDAAAAGLRPCGLPACGAREASVRQFKRCGGCKKMAYCCTEHAREHWKAEHKRACDRSAMQQPA